MTNQTSESNDIDDEENERTEVDDDDEDEEEADRDESNSYQEIQLVGNTETKFNDTDKLCERVRDQHSNSKLNDILASVNRNDLDLFLGNLEEHIRGKTLKKNNAANQTKQLGELFLWLKSETYLNHVKRFFSKESITSQHLTLCYRLVMQMHLHLMSSKPSSSQPSKLPSAENTKHIENLDTSDGLTLAKVRYVGGYAVARNRHLIGKKLDRQLQSIKGKKKKLISIETYIILKHVSGNIGIATEYAESMSEINHRLYGSLTALTDKTFEFFIMLERKRLTTLTSTALAQEGGNLPGAVVKALLVDQQLTQSWLDALKGKIIFEKIIIMKLTGL